MGKQSINNVDRSKVNGILKLFSESTQVYEELFVNSISYKSDENKQMLTGPC